MPSRMCSTPRSRYVHGVIKIDGLSGALTDALVRIERIGGTAQVVRLTPDSPAMVVEAAPRWTRVDAKFVTTLVLWEPHFPLRRAALGADSGPPAWANRRSVAGQCGLARPRSIIRVGALAASIAPLVMVF